MHELVAIVGGATLGALGAVRNRARFRDERLLWMLGGSLGALAAVAIGGALESSAGLERVRQLALVLWGAGSLTASLATPWLDHHPARIAGWGSVAIKALQCPVSTTLGLLVLFLVARPIRPELRHGTLFVPVGPGHWGITLGAVVLAQHALLGASGRMQPTIARHEAYHARNAACLGEWGFYLAYVTAGALRARACAAPWNGLAHDGRGNPFERTAYALERDRNGPPRA